MRRIRATLAAATVCVALAGMGSTMAAGVPTQPGVGSTRVATVSPPVPRPDTKPCVVQLIATQAFGRSGNDARMDAAPHRFHYRPPAGCQGPWAKVVLEADFSVTAGYQYDRTASIWLKGVNLYFGTTQEPLPDVAPHWQVQRDLTDYASLLRTPGAGQVSINNWIGGVRASPIHASARLLFYPADAAFPAPRVPDKVVALNTQGHLPAKLDGPGVQLSRRIVFPRNTARVYLDVFAQPQSHDEFYYMCLPDKVIKNIGRPHSNGSIDRLQTCGGGSFREVEVLIDGKPAGLAPVAPWVFTGGLDPFLWQPGPAAQTLNFMPYRVNLTPFAGVLSDGKAHRVAVQVLGTPHFFAIAGALLVYQDRHTRTTGGAVTRNTLASATLQPKVASTLTVDARGVHGDVLTRARQHYVIEGYVDTAHGRVHSRVETTIGFGNVQQFAGKSQRGRRHITNQTARVDTTSSASGGNSDEGRSLHRVFSYALRVHSLIGTGQGKHRDRAVQVRQRFAKHIVQREAGLPTYRASMSNTHIGADHLTYEQGDRTSFASHGQSGTQDFRFSNSLGDCYQATVQVRDEKVIGSIMGQGCITPGAMHWFVHPDGSPDDFGWRRAITNRSDDAAKRRG